MEVRPGYKQTEVGVIPEDWDVAAIGMVAETSSGTTPPRALADRYYRNGCFAWVKTLDLNNSELYSTEERVTQAALNETSLRCYPSGSVVVAMYGGFNQIGRTGLLRIPATVNQALTAIRPDSRRLRSEYLLSVLNFRADHWKSVASSSRKDPNITGKDIRDFPLALPGVKEQEAIAEALGDADALIESLEQLLVKKRQLKEGAMQELLTGKKRLPGFSREWEVKSLGNAADTDPENLGSDTRPNLTFNYIALEDVDVGTLSSYSEQVFRTAPSRARRKLRKDDVLVSTVRPNLMSHLLFHTDGDNWVCSTGFCVVRCKEGVSHPGYLYFHMFAGCVARQIEALLTGSNYPAINGGDVRALQIPFPEYEEQTAIAAILSDMDAEIAALAAKLIKGRQLKRGMMQELLTGRIRLV